jgi:hypothetical protein
MSKIIKIEGLKIYYEDGQIAKKDYSNLWLYENFYNMDNGISLHENRQWIKTEDGKIELIFP